MSTSSHRMPPAAREEHGQRVRTCSSSVGTASCLQGFLQGAGLGMAKGRVQSRCGCLRFRTWLCHNSDDDDEFSFTNHCKSSGVAGAADGGAPAAESLRAMSGASQAPHAAIVRASHTHATARTWVSGKQTSASQNWGRGTGTARRPRWRIRVCSRARANEARPQRGAPGTRETAAPRVPGEKTRLSHLRGAQPSDLRGDAGRRDGRRRGRRAAAARGQRAACARAGSRT